MGFSFGEIVVLLGVGSWAFGPKELPRLGRALGRMTGQATGLLYKARAQLFQFAEQTELTKVQQEMQATMHQLHAIRSELQSGINILDPGPLTRRVGGSMFSQQQQQQPAAAAPHPQRPHATPRSPSTQPVSPAEALPFAARAAAAEQRSVQDAPSLPVQTATAADTSGNSSSSSGGGSGGGGAQRVLTDGEGSLSFAVLPVSALEAGLVPDRSGSVPSGSQLLADALHEERVARQAAAFLNRQPGPRPPPR